MERRSYPVVVASGGVIEAPLARYPISSPTVVIVLVYMSVYAPTFVVVVVAVEIDEVVEEVLDSRGSILACSWLSCFELNSLLEQAKTFLRVRGHRYRWGSSTTSKL